MVMSFVSLAVDDEDIPKSATMVTITIIAH